MAATSVARRPRRKRVNLKRTLGPWVAGWIESNLCHGPGDVQGQPMHLDSEELRFIFAAYAINDQGRRLVERACYSRPKGRRKSEIAAAICCAEALAPVRFAGFDPKGYPIAQPVTYPFVRIMATEEEQSGNTYDGVYYMLTEGPLREMPGLDAGLTRTFIPGGGEIRPSTGAAASKDGGKESHVCFDETHLYEARHVELVQMHKTVMRNLTKRLAAQPWANETTTMFEPGMNSVAEQAYRYHQQLVTTGAVDPSFLYDHREAPKIRDWDNDDELRAALVDVFGDAAEWVDFDSKIQQLRRGDQTRSDFARFFLNQPTRADDTSLIDLEKWDKMARPGRPTEFIPEMTPVSLGLNGGRDHGQAVVTWATAPDDSGIVRVDLQVIDAVRSRLPDPLGEHVYHQGRVNYEDLIDILTGAFAVRRVRQAAYGSDYIELATQVIDRRLPESRIAQIRRNSNHERAAIAALDTLLSSGKIEHRGDPVLRRQLANTLVKRDPVSRTIMRLQPKSEAEPIHAVYALAYAVWRATLAGKGSVYEERGIRTIEPSQGGHRRAVPDDDARAYYLDRLGDDDDGD